MTDSGGAVFSLMYLPSTSINLPTAVGPIIQVTPTTRASLGLTATWDTALTLPAAGSTVGKSEHLVLCAVYSLGQTPAIT